MILFSVTFPASASLIEGVNELPTLRIVFTADGFSIGSSLAACVETFAFSSWETGCDDCCAGSSD
jgi:hypothetical protein